MLLITNNGFKSIETIILFSLIFLMLIIFIIVRAIKKHSNYKKQMLETQQQILQELKNGKG